MASVIAETLVVGQVGKVYELRRTTKDGNANLDFSIAVTPRRRDENGEWGDGDTTWHNVKVWGRLAENVEQSIKPGDRVIVKGYISLRKGYTKDDGTVVADRNQLTADFVGIDLTFDPAKSERKPRGTGSYNGGGASRGDSNSGGASRKPAQAAAPAPAAKKEESFDDLDFGDDLDFDAPF